MNEDMVVTRVTATTAKDVTEVRTLSKSLLVAKVDSFPQEDDDYDRRPQRRRYEEPLHVKVRKQLLAIAESVRSNASLQRESFGLNDDFLAREETGRRDCRNHSNCC